MQVAMVTPWRVKCGIYTYTRNLVNALADLGLETYIIRLPRFGVLTPELLQNLVESIPLGRVNLIHVQHEYGRYQNLEGSFYGGLKRLGKPVVTTMHGVGNFYADTPIADVSRRVIVHNDFCLRHFTHPRKAAVIPHGCTVMKPLPPEEAKRRLGIPEKTPIVGYCGFISPNKGLELVFDALEPLPNVALLVAGGWFTDAETAYIAQLKQRSLTLLKGRCQWTGYIPDEELPTVYGAMNLAVYPARFTSESGALLMALGYGKAVVASDLPPIREKQGALMTFTDIENLTEKIKLLLEDEKLRKSLEEEAYSYAKTHSWGKIGERHIALYKDMLSEGG